MQRKLSDGLIVRQNSKNSFYNATDLINAWNLENPDNQKRLDHYMELESTKHLMRALEADPQNTQIHGYLPMTSKRGKNGGTYVDPVIFLDIAMWTNVKFKIIALRWIHDGLIEFRNDAGDSYKEMCSAIQDGIQPKDTLAFIEEAKILNKLVFGRHEKGLRQIATPKQLSKLSQLEKLNAQMIREKMPRGKRIETLELYSRVDF